MLYLLSLLLLFPPLSLFLCSSASCVSYLEKKEGSKDYKDRLGFCLVPVCTRDGMWGSVSHVLVCLLCGDCRKMQCDPRFQKDPVKPFLPALDKCFLFFYQTHCTSKIIASGANSCPLMHGVIGV